MIAELFKQWCKETKRNGGVIMGSSIRDFFEWAEQQLQPTLNWIKIKEGMEVVDDELYCLITGLPDGELLPINANYGNVIKQNIAEYIADGFTYCIAYSELIKTLPK